MNPKTPDLLARVIAAAERTLMKPTGDLRRREELERLADDVITAKDWPTDKPPRLIGDWTVLLVNMLRRAEREAPLSRERALAAGLAKLILEYVREDLGRALERARPATTENGR